MGGKSQRPGKQERREGYDRSPAPIEIGNLKGRADAIEGPGWVTSERHRENGVDARALASHGSDETKSAVGTDHVRFRSMGPEHYKQDSVGSFALEKHGSDDSKRAVTLDHCRESMRNPAQDVPGLRAIGTLLGGGSVAAAASNHAHSVMFKRLRRDARVGLLALRRKIRGNREAALEERVRDLEGMVLALCHLAFDDEHVAAEEHERLLATDKEYRGRWLARQKLHMEDGERYWNREGFYGDPHPDVPLADSEPLKPLAAKRRPLPPRQG